MTEKTCVWCSKGATKEQPLEMVLNGLIHREPCLRQADVENKDGVYYEESKKL